MDGTKIRVRMYERDLQLLVCVKERGKLLGHTAHERKEPERRRLILGSGHASRADLRHSFSTQTQMTVEAEE